MPLAAVFRPEPTPAAFALHSLGLVDHQVCQSHMRGPDEVRRFCAVTEVPGRPNWATALLDTAGCNDGLLASL
jgi:hypothetical protein